MGWTMDDSIVEGEPVRDKMKRIQANRDRIRHERQQKEISCQNCGADGSHITWSIETGYACDSCGGQDIYG